MRGWIREVAVAASEGSAELSVALALHPLTHRAGGIGVLPVVTGVVTGAGETGQGQARAWPVPGLLTLHTVRVGGVVRGTGGHVLLQATCGGLQKLEGRGRGGAGGLLVLA